MGQVYSLSIICQIYCCRFTIEIAAFLCGLNKKAFSRRYLTTRNLRVPFHFMWRVLPYKSKRSLRIIVSYRSRCLVLNMLINPRDVNVSDMTIIQESVQPFLFHVLQLAAPLPKQINLRRQEGKKEKIDCRSKIKKHEKYFRVTSSKKKVKLIPR